jgi:hypothetical protein
MNLPRSVGDILSDHVASDQPTKELAGLQIIGSASVLA